MATQYLTALYGTHEDRLTTASDIQFILFDVYETEHDAVRAILKCFIENNICTHETMEKYARAMHNTARWEERYSEHYYPNPGGPYEEFEYNKTVMDDMMDVISTTDDLLHFASGFIEGYGTNWEFNIREI